MLTLTKTKINQYCVLICACNEAENIGEVLRRAALYCRHIIVVDDGSTDDTAEVAEASGATVVRLAKNQGKGHAMNEGFRFVRNHGYDAVITMDADGRHDPADIPKFLEAYNRTGFPLLAGNRMYNTRHMRIVRCCVNRTMAAWLCRISDVYIPDPPCGFRFYRGDVVPFIIAQDTRYCAEFEMLINIAQRNIRIGSVRIAHMPSHEGDQMLPVRDILRFFAVVIAHHRRERQQVLASTDTV